MLTDRNLAELQYGVQYGVCGPSSAATEISRWQLQIFQLGRGLEGGDFLRAGYILFLGNVSIHCIVT